MIIAAVSELAERVVDWSIALGVISLVAGVVLGAFEFSAELKVKKAAAKAAEDAQDVGPSGQKAGDSAAQGALASSVKSVAELASALKDLERSARLLVIGLAFFAIAAVAAGADAIAEDTGEQGSVPAIGWELTA
jgi:hypothetical protein